tara:strand:+ start:953 stop:1126 length:174 start_codon:yes stop_codon:yes gene_type:complete
MNDILIDIENLEQVTDILSQRTVGADVRRGLALLQQMIDEKKNAVDQFEVLYEEDGA